MSYRQRVAPVLPVHKCLQIKSLTSLKGDSKILVKDKFLKKTGAVNARVAYGVGVFNVYTDPGDIERMTRILQVLFGQGEKLFVVCFDVNDDLYFIDSNAFYDLHASLDSLQLDVLLSENLERPDATRSSLFVVTCASSSETFGEIMKLFQFFRHVLLLGYKDLHSLSSLESELKKTRLIKPLLGLNRWRRYTDRMVLTDFHHGAFTFEVNGDTEEIITKISVILED